jgi:hypothetical protein
MKYLKPTNSKKTGSVEARFMRICGTIQGQFRDFQIHFVKQHFGEFRQVGHLVGHTKLPSFAAKTESRVLSREAQNRSLAERKIEIMHARPQIREHLLGRAMQKWALRGRHPSAYPNCPASRARRNFSRLLAKYPHIAQRLGLNALSAYPSL